MYDDSPEPDPYYVSCTTCDEPIGLGTDCEECTEYQLEHQADEPPF